MKEMFHNLDKEAFYHQISELKLKITSLERENVKLCDNAIGKD